MTSDPADRDLQDSLDSIRSVGENADTQPDEKDGPETAGEDNPNPELPDWGSDGVPAEDEPEA